MTLAPDLAEIRFGTGLAPLIRPPADVATIMDRLRGPDLAARDWPQPGYDEKVERTLRWNVLRRERNDDQETADRYRRLTRQMRAEQHLDLARAIARAATTDDGFRERLWWFWIDHFAVSDGPGFLRQTVAGYHEEAIRPHLAGRFSDLLLAAVTHPAMLAYLTADRSVGPNSARARGSKAGLNENLGRELLELHTVGVGGGYDQTDVRELAKLLAGLSIDGKTGAFRFRRDHVEPGPEIVLGRAYPGDDIDAIRAVVADLARRPETAAHLSHKLARHFVSDTPDRGLVGAMTQAWLDTDGDLPAVYRAMLEHPASAEPVLRKVRRPLDLMAAAARALAAGPALMNGTDKARRDALATPIRLMGQPYPQPPGPDGFPEEGTAWITPQGLAARIDWAMLAPSLLPEGLPDPRAFVDWSLGRFASPRTRFAAQAAETRADGVGLVLASPEFQRR